VADLTPNNSTTINEAINLFLTSCAAENHAVELEWIQMTCSPALCDVNVKRPSSAYIFTTQRHNHNLTHHVCLHYIVHTKPTTSLTDTDNCIRRSGQSPKEQIPVVIFLTK